MSSGSGTTVRSGEASMEDDSTGAMVGAKAMVIWGCWFSQGTPSGTTTRNAMTRSLYSKDKRVTYRGQ